MNAFVPILLSGLQQFGYPILWIIVFIAAIGLPLPISLLLLGAAAFAAQGDFNIYLLGVIAITASVSGDSASYWIGRHWGSSLLNRLERSRRQRIVTTRRITQARDYFNRFGGWAIFLSRFLFSGLGGITNILAGADTYPYLRFLIYDILGEILGAAIPLALGYVFSVSWEAIGDVLGAFSGFTLALLISVILIYQFFQAMRRIRAARVVKQNEKSKHAIMIDNQINDRNKQISENLPL